MRTLIKNNQLHIWLPNKLFNNLQGAVEQHNKTLPKVKINFAKAAFIMNLFYYLPLKSDDKYSDGWIPLCSEKLGTFKGYKRYIEFLQVNGFIDKFVVDYSTSSNNCKRYSLTSNYQKQSIALQYLSDNSHFIKKMNKYNNQREVEADKRCGHLTKWLNPKHFTIDFDEAITYIKKAYSEKSNLQKKNKRLFVVYSIQNKIWTYSREGTDDRLHSMLTSLPKDIRRFVKYKEESLISFDIKNCQPFILSSILNQLINPNVNKINNIIYKRDIKLYTSIMSDLFISSLNYNEIQNFINLVQDGKFYEYFGEQLYKRGLVSKDINNKCYVGQPKEIKGIWITTQKRYNNLRKASKEIVMLTQFSSENAHSKFIDAFMDMFPEVFRIIQFIKKDRDKNFLPVLLQNIEANCVLDFSTELISRKHPDMPLFTIHDCIITIPKYQSILNEELLSLMGKYFGMTPKLSCKTWNNDLLVAS